MAEQINDVNVEAMRALDRSIRENPALAKRTVKLRSTWQRGTKALVEVGTHEVAGKAVTPRTRRFTLMTDAPPGLGGVDSGPAPIETLLIAVAGCVTSGIAANAALFDVPIDGLDIDMEGDIDLRGLLGHDKSIRNGFSDIRFTVTIRSSAPEEKVRRCKETIDRKSIVLDTLVNGVKVSSEFVYKPH
jgi:uncharacterized OsmC-like protein